MEKQDLMPKGFRETKSIEQMAQAIRDLTTEIQEMRSDLAQIIKQKP